MDDAVQQGGGDFGVGKDVVPACELKISGNNEGFTLVALGDDLKEELGAVGVDGNIAPFVADEQVELVEMLHKAGERALTLGLGEGVDKDGSAPEPCPESGVTGGDADGDGKMGLAGADVAVKDEVFFFGDESGIDKVVGGKCLRELDILESVFLKGLNDIELSGLLVGVAALAVALVEFGVE